MKIAILYICIGKYSVFFDEFYESAEKHLFEDSEKFFYVWTDDKSLLKKSLYNVQFRVANDLGWPKNTLYRFKYFNEIIDEISDFEYVYFFNANAMFVKDISTEIMPKKSNLILAQHFKFINRDNYDYPYERNKKSTAFVEWGDGKDYIQACFFGATSEEMKRIITELDYNITKDEENSIVAIWHDESHLNKYIIEKSYDILPPSYVYPESLHLDIDINILMRNKERYGSLTTIRNQNNSYSSLIITKLKNQRFKIIILLRKILRIFQIK